MRQKAKTIIPLMLVLDSNIFFCASLCQFPMFPIDGALMESIDLQKSHECDENVHKSVALQEHVTASREKALRNVA